jgi:hypothetical protein
LAFPRLLALKGCADSMPPESLLVPCVVQIPTCRLSMLTTLNRFDAPQDIALEDWCMGDRTMAKRSGTIALSLT